QIYVHKGERDRGLLYERKAVESEPDNGTYWHYLGRVYHEMSGPEMLPLAIRCYREANRRRPQDGDIWFDLGRAYAAAQHWEEALTATTAPKPGGGAGAAAIRDRARQLLALADRLQSAPAAGPARREPAAVPGVARPATEPEPGARPAPGRTPPGNAGRP